MPSATSFAPFAPLAPLTPFAPFAPFAPLAPFLGRSYHGAGRQRVLPVAASQAIAALPATPAPSAKIGRASCRERV